MIGTLLFCAGIFLGGVAGFALGWLTFRAEILDMRKKWSQYYNIVDRSKGMRPCSSWESLSGRDPGLLPPGERPDAAQTLRELETLFSEAGS